MKLRQKLAMALAAAMVVTAVPVTTMAASTNSFNKTITIMKNDILDSTTGLALNIDVANIDENTQTTFYVEASGLEFTEDAYAATAGVTWLNKTTLRVTTTGDVAVPVYGKVTGDSPTITVDGEGSVVSSGKYSILGDKTVATKALTVSVGDVKSISIDGTGTIAEIKIEETIAKSLNNEFVKIELDRSSDLEFAPSQTIKVTGERGHAGKEGTAEVVSIEENEMVIKLTGFNSTDRGAIKLTNIAVVAEGREDVPTGDVEATITSVDKDGVRKEKEAFEKIEEVVAKVSEFDVNVSVKDDKALEFVAGGKAQTVEVTLAELAAGSLDDNDRVYFKVEGASVVAIQVGDQKKVEVKDLTSKEDKKNKLVGNYDKKDGVSTTSDLYYSKDDNEFTLNLNNIDEKAVSKYTVKLTLAAKPEATEDIKVVATSRAFDDSREVVVGTVEADRKIANKAVNLNVGQRGQFGGEITITENEAETLQKGEILWVTLEGAAMEDDITIRDFKVAGTEGLEVEKVEIAKVNNGTEAKPEWAIEASKGSDKYVIDNKIAVKVVRESDEAATLTINEIKFDTNNRTPEGSYKAVLSGTAISENGHEVEVKEFITVGEKNVSVGTTKEVKVTVDSKEYTVDGETKEAIAAPYVEAGRTMIPLRFVSEEFGAKVDFGTINGVGTITINKDGKVIQFQNGSNVMNQNGIMVPMDAKAVVKDGTTFVPFRYLANGLEVEFEWAPETKTITFKN